MYTLWCWCTPTQYDVHAYHSVMILSNALWCILVVDDAYTMHTEMMMMWIWLWGCIPYDDDAHLWQWCTPMTMHSLCSVKPQHNYMMRCTMMYMRSVWKWNDLFVYMDDLQLKWLDGIRGWVGSDQSVEVTKSNSEFGLTGSKAGNPFLIWVATWGKEKRLYPPFGCRWKTV